MVKYKILNTNLVIYKKQATVWKRTNKTAIPTKCAMNQIHYVGIAVMYLSVFRLFFFYDWVSSTHLHCFCFVLNFNWSLLEFFLTHLFSFLLCLFSPFLLCFFFHYVLCLLYSLSSLNIIIVVAFLNLIQIINFKQPNI